MRVACMARLDILVEPPCVLYLNCTAGRLNAGQCIIPWSYRLRPTGLQAIY
ncbi:MAG: hypothetical protein ACJ8FA_14575 [Xanthobacteraceae bacterium]